MYFNISVTSRKVTTSRLGHTTVWSQLVSPASWFRELRFLVSSFSVACSSSRRTNLMSCCTVCVIMSCHYWMLSKALFCISARWLSKDSQPRQCQNWSVLWTQEIWLQEEIEAFSVCKHCQPVVYQLLHLVFTEDIFYYYLKICLRHTLKWRNNSALSGSMSVCLINNVTTLL